MARSGPGQNNSGFIQRALRSQTNSTISARPAAIGVTGPLIRAPRPMANQKRIAVFRPPAPKRKFANAAIASVVQPTSIASVLAMPPSMPSRTVTANRAAPAKAASRPISLCPPQKQASPARITPSREGRR